VSTTGKKRRHPRPHQPAPVAETVVRVAAAPAPIAAWLTAGVVLLYVAACGYGALEVHYSTDTWIGLAAGRQIMTEPTFPKADTFSYTFYGQTWFNQNWLSHVFFWELYDKLGPDAVVFGTWAISAGMFTLVLLATRLRCGSWLAATLVATMVAIASRDWLSIRPATIQFFMMAAAWLGLSALLGQGARHRRWPLVLLLVTYAVWPHAHGSFLFGFGLLGLFLVCAAIARVTGLKSTTDRQVLAIAGIGFLAAMLGVVVDPHGLRNAFALAAVTFGCAGIIRVVFRRWRIAPVISESQAVILAGIGLLTAVLGAVLSPYGIENFTHPFKVVESAVFRTVGEWFPPYITGRFPGVTRFWVALAIAAASPLVILLLRAIDSGSPREPASERAPLALHALLFDVSSVAIGLGMAMFARRFAPVFYILAAPALASWILRVARPLSDRLRHYAREILLAAAWVGAAGVGAHAGVLAYTDLVTNVTPDGPYNLLDRVTNNDHSPLAAVEFLRRNQLTPNVMTEWKVAAAIMFYVPGARVFIDGRAQQVYDEKQYTAYLGLLSIPANQGAVASQVLDRCGTDLILLPKWDVTFRLMQALQEQPQWRPVMEEPIAVIWVREGSKLMTELLERERAGTLWWPDRAESQWRHGLFMVDADPSNVVRALPLWQAAVARQPSLGRRAYAVIVGALLQEGRADEAAAYLRQERAKLTTLQPKLRPDLHAALVKEIQQCEALLPGTAPGGVPP
jgi:hypothetical protein